MAEIKEKKMSEKLKACENKAENVETRKKDKRKDLAAELGELTLERAVLTEQLNRNATRSNQIAMEMAKLPKE